MSDVLSGVAVGAGVGGPFGATIGGTLGAIGDIFKSGADQANVAVSHAQAEADISTYQAYLDQFPGYAAAKETEFQTKEQETLGDRLAAMGMRGIQTGGAGAATSSATVYSTEKSLWDTGYTQLVQSLNLEKKKAENQLKVAQKTAEETKTGGLFGHGGFLGTGLGGDWFG